MAATSSSSIRNSNSRLCLLTLNLFLALDTVNCFAAVRPAARSTSSTHRKLFVSAQRQQQSALQVSSSSSSGSYYNATISSPIRYSNFTVVPDYNHPQSSNSDDVWSPVGIDSAQLDALEQAAQRGESSLTLSSSSDEENTAEEANQAAVNNARLLLVAAAALYGTNFACVKLLGGTDMPIAISSTLRFGLAALATSPWLWMKDDTFDDVAKQQAFMGGLQVGLWNSIGYVAQAVGLETTSASKSAFLCSLAVVIVPILDFFAGKRLKHREVLGALAALVGVGLLELGGAENLQLTQGDLISLLQPLAFGMGFWKMEAAMHAHPEQANRSTAAQLLAVFLGSAVYTAYVSMSSNDNAFDLQQVQQWLVDPWIWAGLFWTGCITTALTVYMETVALKTLSAAETTLIFSTEPLWGSLTAALVLHETFGLSAITGGGLILAGCVYSNLGITGLQDQFSQLFGSSKKAPKNE